MEPGRAGPNLRAGGDELREEEPNVEGAVEHEVAALAEDDVEEGYDAVAGAGWGTSTGLKMGS